MATIASALLARKKEPQDDEQLLKLFWNRAELKKELATLRREKDKLTDLIRQQEDLSQRAQQRLDQLENLLADPAQSANALVYYQLRGIWQHNRRRLERLAQELSARQQEREHQHARSRFEQGRDQAISAIDEKLAGLAQRVRVMEEDLRVTQARIGQLRGFWHYLRRRALHDQCETIRATVEGVQLQIRRLEANRRERELEPGPPFAGLSVEGRRNINLALIAMAQQLLLHYADGDVAWLAREAAVRPLTELAYGNPAECRAINQRIEAVMRALPAEELMQSRVRRRSEYLRQTATYRRDIDTIPMAAGFAGIPLAITEAGELRPASDQVVPINVLADEYWDIYSMLLN
jgi:hypothetical protein